MGIEDCPVEPLRNYNRYGAPKESLLMNFQTSSWYY
jgi:hypothetical protein